MPRPKPLRIADADRVIALVRSLGLPIAALDVRADGVTVHVAQPALSNDAGAGSAFDAWQTQDQGDGRPPHRRQ